MQLALHVETLRGQLIASAETGGADTKDAAERLAAALEAAMRLVMLETLSAAADEITAELAPGAVELRLRGRDPYFVVTLPPDAAREASADEGATPRGAVPYGADEGGTSRLNLRLPDSLKAMIEEAARREGLSLNAWLVRIAAAAVEASQGPPARNPSGSQRFTGWVR